MSTTSTVPAFKAALTARLLADAALGNGGAGVQVAMLDPFPVKPAAEYVIVGRARPEDALRDSGFGGGQVTAAMGRRRREERYVVEVVCRVAASRNVDAAQTETRAYAMAAAVALSVDAWADSVPPFDGVVRVALVVRTEDWHGLDDQNREARVTVGIGVSARIGV